jgi:hypothetical protein
MAIAAWIAAVGIKEWPALMMKPLCTKCEGLMLRVADNILGPYFEEIPDLLKEVMTEEGLRVGGNHVTARRGDQEDQPGTFPNLSQELGERSQFRADKR